MLPFARMLEYGNTVLHPIITGELTSITPSPLSSRYGHAMCTDGTYIYSFGGYTGSIVNTLTRIDISDNSTVSLSTGPSNRYGSVGFCYWNDYIYCFGGTTNTTGTSNVTDFWKYQVSTDTWTNITTTTTNWPGQRGFACAIDDKLYLYGFNSSLYIYDIPTDTWDSGTSYPGTVNIVDGGICTDGINVYLCAQNTQSTSLVWTYNISTGTFKKGSINPDSRESRVVAIGGFVYTFRSGAICAYNPDYDTWEVLRPAQGTGSLRRNGMVNIGNVIYSICGDTNANANGGGGTLSSASYIIT